MGNGSFAAKVRSALLILGIVLLVYNVTLFVLCGVEDHGGAFWVSYAFVMISFAVVCITGFLLRGKPMEPTDWLLGYPFFKHCTIYVVVEFILSVMLMILDATVDFSWAAAFVIQMIVLGVHLVFNISCFAAKAMIEGVQKKVAVKTSFMKEMRVNVETYVPKVNDRELRELFAQLSDQLKYSDPVSNDALAEIETRLSAQINEAMVFANCNDKEGALLACKKSMLLLNERNAKCKLLKK